MRTPLRLAIVVTTGGLAAILITAGIGDPAYPLGRLLLGAGVGCAMVVAGLTAVRTDERWVGILAAAAGLAWLGERSLEAVDADVTFLIGLLVSGLWAPFVFHAFIAFPSSRGMSRPARVVAIAGYLNPLTNFTNHMFVASFRDLGRDTRNPFALEGDPVLAETIRRAGETATLIWVTAVLVVLIAKVVSASPPARRAYGPVWVAGSALALGGVVAVSASLELVPPQEAFGLWIEIAAGVASILLAGSLVYTRFAQERLVSLVVALQHEHADLRHELRRALKDPSLEVVYRRTVPEGWIDQAGHPIELPGADEGRGLTFIDRGDVRVGALIHDPALLRDPERLKAVHGAAGLAIENQRLQAGLRAHLLDVRESRARLVEAGDRERRRVERNLHDGAQQRLMGVALTLRMATSRSSDASPEVRELLSEAGVELDGALADLRELARGLHPAIVTDVGLAGALEALAERSTIPVRLTIDVPRRFPEPIEVGLYYVVTEALTNAMRHSGAGRVDVAAAWEDGTLWIEVVDDGRGGAVIEAGSGLEGLHDRVWAIGGRIQIASAEGAGTRLRVEVPCE